MGGPAILYAAESLLEARTGVGRAALEVARAASGLPGIAGIHPVAHGRLLPPEYSDRAIV